MPEISPRFAGLFVLSITVLSLLLHLHGIRRDLPYTPEVDEPSHVEPALRMATSGDLNPRRFGNPGFTVIYPLATVYRMRCALTTFPFPWEPCPELQELYQTRPGEFYLLGRLLTVLYGVLTVPLVYLIGRRVFNEAVGIVGAWLFVSYPLAVSHAQMVRTDSAATFFGALSVWLILRLYWQPSQSNHIFAGVAIGLAIISRYFMVVLILVLLTVDALVAARKDQRCNLSGRRLLVAVSSGLAATAGVLLVYAPFYVAAFSTVLKDLRHEARDTLPGADGLSRIGNFLYYLEVAIPKTLTLPQTLLALAGGFAVLVKRKIPQAALLFFLSFFLAVISIPALHWQRWIIPILPVLAVIVASAIELVARGIWQCFCRRSVWVYSTIILASTVAVSAGPMYELFRSNIRQSNYSTRVVARHWLLANLSPESRVAKEYYTAPLKPGDFAVLREWFSLAAGRRLEDYFIDGYEYLIVSSGIYNRFLSAPEKYPNEVSFYRELFARGHLLHRIEPSGDYLPGPTIIVYDIRDAAEAYMKTLDWAAQPTDILIRANAFADPEVAQTIRGHLLFRLPINLDIVLVDAANVPRIRVLGYALGPFEPSQGSTELRLYFEALNRLEIDYRIFLHGVVKDVSILPPERRQYGFANWGSLPPQIATSLWRSRHIYMHGHRIQAQPGEYRLRFGLWEPSSKTRLFVQGSGAENIDLGWHVIP